MKIKEQEMICEISDRATKAVFWWCCSQVEKGFGGTIVPRRFGRDEPLVMKESKPKEPGFIHAWLDNVST